jgi:hypothetical protein
VGGGGASAGLLPLNGFLPRPACSRSPRRSSADAGVAESTTRDLARGRDARPVRTSTVAPFLGGLYGQAGEFATARGLIAEAEPLTGFGAATTAFTNAERCEQTSASRAIFTRRRRRCVSSAITSSAWAIGRTWRYGPPRSRWRRSTGNDAGRVRILVLVSRSCAASDDQSAQLVVGAAERSYSRKGAVSDAQELADGTVSLADGTDGLNDRSRARARRGARAADLTASPSRHPRGDRSVRAQGQFGGCSRGRRSPGSEVPVPGKEALRASFIVSVGVACRPPSAYATSGAASASRLTASTTCSRW